MSSDQQWRRFEPHVEQLAATCASELWSVEPFAATGGTGGGGSTAVQVRMDASNLLAWVKPARVSGDSSIHVAYEKIAADIAHRLGLPVAPVILATGKQLTVPPSVTLPPGISLPPIVAVSYETLRQPKPWGELAPQLAAEQKDQVKVVATAMRVFHALICDTDHNGLGANAQFERAADGIMRASYFDHSNSMTRAGWNPPAAAPAWNAWPGDFANPDRAVVDAVLARMEQLLAPDDLRAIIGRIPDGCLPSPTRDALLTGLNDRRRGLREILKQ